jgi:hypothetical protein
MRRTMPVALAAGRDATSTQGSARQLGEVVHDSGAGARLYGSFSSLPAKYFALVPTMIRAASPEPVRES